MEDVKCWNKLPYNGSVETAVAPFWRLFTTHLSNVRIVVVRRPVTEVAASLSRVMTRKVPQADLISFLTRLDSKLIQVSKRLPNSVIVGYNELTTLEGAAKVFEYALQFPFDEPWWNTLASVNIQEPFTTFERYAAAYLPQLTRTAQLAKGAILREMALREPRHVEGVEFTEEPFGEFLRDGAKVFAEHSHAVGEVPESFRDKNIPLLQAISDAGGMQIVTARSNGRMFGYLMTELSPSRESPTRTSAVETTFFASGVIPGLGMKLQRETLRRLRSKGIDEVWFRAGPRGNGPKMPSMFRRVGAEPSGSLWRLELSDKGSL
jgi:hypothetical protein